MRVTKLIKVYVEKEVGAIYDAKMEEVRKPYNEAKAEAEEIIQQIALHANEEIAQKLADSGFKPWSDYKDYLEFGAIINHDKWDKIQAELYTLREEKKNKIEDILITLELGHTTREELDDIIRGLRCDN